MNCRTLLILMTLIFTGLHCVMCVTGEVSAAETVPIQEAESEEQTEEKYYNCDRLFMNDDRSQNAFNRYTLAYINPTYPVLTEPPRSVL